MNEQVARDVVLVRAIETADRKHEVLSEEDRLYASRSAKELAQWQAADSAVQPNAEHFLQHRADQILKKIGQRHPTFTSFSRPGQSASLLLLILPTVALLSGIGVDRIANPHRVDLLSGPLLAIIAWNLFVYVAMLLSLFNLRFTARRFDTGWLQKLAVGKQGVPRKLPQVLSTALLAFANEWAQLSRTLVLARLRRTLHLSAALLAAGVIASLYARGILSEYVVGWESTFLNPSQVHAVLSALFAPAVAIFPLQPFTLGDIEALRFSNPAPPAQGARWVHLYAATLLLLVVIPRALFAAYYHWRARRLETDFPVDLHQPYFQKFDAVLGDRVVTLRVLPYSFTIDERRHRGLTAIATSLYGPQSRLMLRPPLTYGEEPAAVIKDLPVEEDEDTVTAVLFNLTATPEKEAHGALLKYLAQRSKRGIAALVDESGFLDKAGSDAGSRARHAERILLWRQFCDFHQVPATFVNLLEPDAGQMEAGAGLQLSSRT